MLYAKLLFIKNKMSFKLSPSKSTVYMSSLPFRFTNNDLHKLLSTYGRIAKVTMMKCKETRKSKGVAFIQFVEAIAANKCVEAMNDKEVYGRKIKCSIAKDNGRTTEFIKKKSYLNKSTCYECGDAGHLSYSCPKNLLGIRLTPVKVEKKKRIKKDHCSRVEKIPDEDSNEEYESKLDIMETLSYAIQDQHDKEYQEADLHQETNFTRKKYKKSSYFSDEESLSD